jgi:hypothetical protein
MSNKSFVIRYIIAAVIVIAVGSGIFFAVFSLTGKTKTTASSQPAVTVSTTAPEAAFPEAATAQSLVVNGTAINDSRNSSPAPKLKNSYSVSSLSYTFDFYDDNSNKYIVTVDPSEGENMLTLYTEDNQFNRSSVYVTAPDGYKIKAPYTKAVSDCFSYKANNDTLCPYILQVYFYLDGDTQNSDKPSIISSFYAISNRTLRKISLIDNTGEQPVKMEYTPDTDLYFALPYTLMSDIKVIEGEKSEYPEIFTYSFDIVNFTLTKNKEEFSEDNPAFFGYGYYALADNVYRYFTVDNYAINSEDGYYEIPVIDQSSNSNDYLYSEFYFTIDDSRFNTVDTLKAYMRTLFSKDIADKIFNEAPQKYKDFDGTLHAITASSGWPYGTGRLIITSYAEYNTDSRKKKIYDTQQELLDDYGNIIGYADRGSFTIEYYSNMSEAVPNYPQNCYSASPQGWIFTSYNYILPPPE